MIGWDSFYVFAICIAQCILSAAIISLFKQQTKTIHMFVVIIQIIGIVILSIYIIGLSFRLHRLPLQTMGEIRLWYVFFLSLLGLIIYLRWRYRWMLLFTALMSIMFMLINILRPEIHNQHIMPALRSVWFVPHVILYMFSYAFLACSFLIAVAGLVKQQSAYMHVCDHMASRGVALFTIAMLLGAIWAKEAWGHYWTWDAKEIWAAITWMFYLLYLHFRNFNPKHYIVSYVILLLAFFALQMCWYGVNIFPSLKGSLHNYI
ncbi:MAG: cytochrome c biogenesis protein CcsA [Bacteroidales bacterium]|jgi:ABC-type transport system involved in cytochrome c biogenesis permease subunit|nr:cytochrome c biogenesis protein CcsA [Bacteroidales bacterium]MDD2687651.1 cytochrome c biogenesis protein CcsA [Bacteroidales bacterium]MDD3330448.1 cytochrome c biogenesis protein CcsA [Bacteroidales bacterium]MDD3691285.1 cytochrome c biogenesis protein CcsA [Bacteroidales bacterium]MDD4044225.1 cytochrome c biogenesis protein CcsA [Bacteroidales bacterium]